MIRAVIFDFDGVIYNSTPYTKKARDIYLKEYSVKVSDKDRSELLGRALRDQLAIITKKYNTLLDYDDFSKKTRDIQVQLMKGKVKPNEGVKELIDDLLKNKIKIAIASSNLKKFILEDLKLMNLSDKFKVITSAEEIKHHKPNPETFLVTAKKLDVKPKECVVIEDAVNGIEASKRKIILFNQIIKLFWLDNLYPFKLFYS